jgi:2-oxoglutarate ferredoxin oxidoreductase subunit delta
MAAKIVINTERCKGCGLCVKVCPRNTIVISEQSNKGGYFPAVAKADGCTGCAMCAIICPEAIIEVYKDSSIVDIEPKRKAAGDKVELAGKASEESLED